MLRKLYYSGVAIVSCIVLILYIVTNVFAHEIWVEKRDGKLVMLYGHIEKNEFDPIKLARIKELKGFDKKGKNIKVNIQQNGDILISCAQEIGAIQIVYETGYWVKTTEGWKEMTKKMAKEESVQYLESIHSMKYSKSLFSWNRKFSEPFGMRFEIVPLKNPFLVKIGETLPIKVLFEGKPLKDALIQILGYGKEPKEVVTNKEGIANVPIIEKGIHMIATKHKIPLKNNPDADYLYVVTTLTFEVK